MKKANLLHAPNSVVFVPLYNEESMHLIMYCLYLYNEESMPCYLPKKVTNNQLSTALIRSLDSQLLTSYGNMLASVSRHCFFSEGIVAKLGQLIINLNKKMIELQKTKSRELIVP